MHHTVRLAITSTLVAMLTAPGIFPGLSAAAAVGEPVTQDRYITGSLTIDWDTRLPQNMEDDHPKLGITDNYQMDATVGYTFYRGRIKCLPYVFSKHIGRVLQEGSCQYDLDLGVINPANTSQQRVVGKLVGTAPLDESGRSNLSDTNLRIEVQTVGQARGFSSKFSGVVIGRPVKAKTTLSKLVETAKKQSATISRMAGGKRVSVTLENVDPVTFQAVQVAAGPAANYPEATVEGQLIYSYETDNWFPNLTLTYGETKDTLSGGMKWVDDSETTGHYDLNILVNEEQGAQGEAAAFAEAQGEEAFFVADPNKSAFNGTIAFKDTHMGGVEIPIKSEVTYNVGLQRVTPQQAQVFWKALLLIPNQLYGE
jgi:hypothetical protein